MNPRNNSGMTWVEFLVVLAVVGVLLALALPPTGGGGLKKGQMTQTLSNMRQLHLATQQMALDGEATTNANLGWPGDTGATFARWANNMVPGYMSTNDFCKLLTAPGVYVKEIPKDNRVGAVRVYAVSGKSSNDVVLLTSANFTNSPEGGSALNPKTKPYGDKGFVVFRKGGDGAILLNRQVGMTNIIGGYVPLCQ